MRQAEQASHDRRHAPRDDPNGAEATDGLTRADVVGRDGIEPPTLRFSAASDGRTWVTFTVRGGGPHFFRRGEYLTRKCVL